MKHIFFRVFLLFSVVLILSIEKTIAQCQPIIPNVDSTPAGVSFDADTIYVDGCPGDVFSITAYGEYPQNGTLYTQSDATSTFEWSVDGTTHAGQTLSQTFSDPGGYDSYLSLTITDVNNCSETVDYIIRYRVSFPVHFAGSNVSFMCLEDTGTLFVGASPYGTIQVQTDDWMQEHETTLATEVFLDDASAGGSTVYNSTLTIDYFTPGQTLTNIADLEGILLNIEHSFSGDLSIVITAPNGTQVILYNQGSPGGTDLGEPWASAPLADLNSSDHTPGIGYDYLFVPSGAQYGTFLDEMGNHTHTYTTTTSPTSNPSSYTLTSTYLPAGSYQPENSFNALIGTPLNGNWTITVIDNIPEDNGYFFYWGIFFSDYLYPSTWGFQTTIDSLYWTSASAGSNIVYTNHDTLQISHDTDGTFSYTLHAVDHFGCESDTTFTITVHPDGHPNCPCEDLDFSVLVDSTNCAFSDGAATINVTNGGSPPFTYQWNDPANQTTQTASGLSEGNYSVTVSYEAGGQTCSTDTTVFVPEKEGIQSIVVTGGDVSCIGASDAMGWVDLVGGGTPPYTYQWSDGQQTDTAYNLSVGQYTVTVTDSGGCSMTSMPILVQENSSSPINIVAVQTVSDVTCFGGNDGQAVVDYTGTNPPHSISWNDPSNQTTTLASNLTAGVYTATVTDANGCMAFDSTEVVDPPAMQTSIGFDSVLCYGGSDGIAYVEVTGNATPPYTYQWDDGLGQQTDTASGLIAGWYHVAVTDANGCTGEDSIYIAEPLELTLSMDSTDVSCFGSNDGSALATVSGGTMPYTYQWDDGLNQTTSTANSLVAGIYTVTVMDANGCMIEDSVEVNEPTVLVIASIDSQDVTCHGGNDGMAWVVSTGGTLPYTYQWDDGLNQTTSTANSLVAGIYTVTVMDANGCMIEDSIVVNEPTALVIASIDSQDVTCHGGNDGMAWVVSTGGTLPYTYQWDDGLFQQTDTAYNLVAGMYTVLVTDANGCTAFDSTEVVEPPAMQTSIGFDSVLCYGGSDGIAYVEVTGNATPPYTYQWDDGLGQQTDTASGLTAGWYHVAVTDANGCIGEDSIYVAEPLELTLSMDSTDVSCFGSNDGSALATVIGGTMPYTYQWDDGLNQTASTANSLVAGIYTVTVTDANGCMIEDSIVVNEPTVLVIASIDSQDVTCHGGNDGSALATASGGTMPYTYQWDDGLNQTTSTANSLVAGTYTVTVTDANGCMVEDSIVVNEPTALVIASIDSQDVTCHGGNDGMAWVVSTGGTMPYTYQWDDGLNQTTSTAYNLVAGMYTVLVSDGNGCTTTAGIEVIEPLAIQPVVVSVDSVSCFGLSDGLVELAATHGVSPFEYSIDGINYQSSPQIGGLSEGVYTGFIRDADGCVDQISFEIGAPMPITINLFVDGVTCAGFSDGEIQVNAEDGTAPYEYSIDGSSYQSSNQFSGLLAGNYTITVRDVNGCEMTGSTTVSEPDSLTMTVSIDSISCSGANDGFIELTGGGGTGTYIYRLIQGIDTTTDASGQFSNLSIGTYILEIEDANGCVYGEMAVLEEPLPDEFSYRTDSVSCFGIEDGRIHIDILTPNNGPYTFLVEGTNVSTTNTTIGNLSAGVYNLISTNGNGCTDRIESILIESPAPVLVEVFPSEVDIELGEDVALSVDVENAVGNIDIQWFPNTGLDCSDCLNPVSTPYNDVAYTVVVTDQQGCFGEASAFVRVGDAMPVYIPNAFTPNGDGFNDSFEVYGNNVKTVRMMIFNRWGEKVYESEGLDKGWDGTYKGTLQSAGVYTYYIEVVFLNNQEEIQKGSVSLIR